MRNRATTSFVLCGLLMAFGAGCDNDPGGPSAASHASGSRPMTSAEPSAEPAPSASESRVAPPQSSASASNKRTAPSKQVRSSKVRVWPPRPAASPPSGDRLYSKVRHLWIRPFPDSRAWLGYLSLGDSVRVRDGDAEKARGRRGGTTRCQWWYRVEPMGWACAGTDATLDANDPQIVELRRHRAKRDDPWPYEYGESVGIPVYKKLPTPTMQRNREARLERHFKRLEKARAVPKGPKQKTRIEEIHKSLKGIDVALTGRQPPKLFDLGPAGNTLARSVARGSTVAMTESFDHGGRAWWLTWDRGIVPKDKVRHYPKWDFRGVILEGDEQLPLAFFRKRARPKYVRGKDGGFTKTNESWARLAHVGLTGKTERFEGQTYHETKQEGRWCAERDIVTARKAKKVPSRIARRKEGRRTWLDISILRGVMVAYENDKPVYATLISPGRGGIPRPGVPPLDTAATPTGQYSVLGKFLTATMTSGSNVNLVHAEVQYTQNFEGPYALHGAYWHNSWGEPKSGGCVNLSPIDAERIFAWSEPRLPDGWHGMRTTEHFGPLTLVVLRR